MTGIFNKKYWLIILLGLSLVLTGSSVLAQAEGEGEGNDQATTISPEDQAASEFFQEWTQEERDILDYFEPNDGQAIQNRQDNDQQQTQTESETLSDLQQQDLEQCTAQVNGSGTTNGNENGGGSSNGNGSGNGNGGGSGNGNGNGTSGGDEQAVRDKLRANNITINHANDCNGQAYQLVSGGCTDVAGLPQHSIDRLGELSRETGGPIMLTGGTEAGHSASSWGHAPGNNVVDLQRNNAGLNNYINQHKTSTWSSSYGTWYQLDNGDRFLDEGDHWHAQLRGTTGGTTALINNSKKFAQQAWQGIKSFVWPIVEAISSTNLNIAIGTQMVDLGSASPTQINQAYASLSTNEINGLFSSLNSSQNQTLVSQLNFSNINNTFSVLNSSNLNRTVNQLNSNSLTGLVNNLVPSNLDNMVLNINSGSLSSTINSISRQGQSTLFASLSTSAVDHVVNSLGGGAINDLMGNLGMGSINNIFNQVSNGLINNMVGSLGMSSLNQVFNNLGSQTMNQVMNNVTSGTLNNVLPDLGTSSLDNVFNEASPDVLTNALDGVSSDVLDDVTNSLSPETITNLDEDVASMLGPEITGSGGIIPPTGTSIDPLTSALTGSGLYVPVVEQDGKLMQLTSSIDTTEKQIKDLSVQICTHLKAIRRIQVKFETAAMEEAAINRLSSTEVEKYRQATADVINTGYTNNDGDQKSGPLFVTNTRDFWEQNVTEGSLLKLNKIANSSNRDKEKIIKGVLEQPKDLGLEQSMTDNDWDALEKGITNTRAGGSSENLAINNTLDNIPLISSYIIKPIKKTLVYLTGEKVLAEATTTTNSQNKDEDYWNAWKKLMEPRNNKYGSFLIAQDVVGSGKEESLAIAQHETQAAQDFLPVRECAKWTTTEPKICEVWVTKTPGIMVKEAGAGALNARLDEYKNPKPGMVGTGNEPNTNEFSDGFKPGSGGGDNGGGGAAGTGNVKPSQIPNTTNERQSSPNTNSPNPQGGDDEGGSSDGGDGSDTTPELPGGLDFNNITALIDGIFNNGDDPDQSETDWLQWLISLFSGVLEKVKPVIFADDKDRSGEESLIYWFSPNATTCVTDNAWLSATTTIKAKGANLGSSDSLRITYPATTSTSVSYLIKCTNTKGSLVKEVKVEKR